MFETNKWGRAGRACTMAQVNAFRSGAAMELA